MQALSLGVHIPLVCFGIAFPAMVLFVEWLWHRTGDATYLTLAKRWSRVMLILFAVGVVTGTILSFELGLLWPRFMEQWGEVFGFAFAIEGLFFFCRGDLHRDLRLRLGSAVAANAHAHRAGGRRLGHRRLNVGDRRKRLDEQPAGIRPRLQRPGDRRAALRGPVQPEPLARGSPHVHGGAHRGLGARGRRLRRRLAAGAARPLPPRRAHHPARGPLARGPRPARHRRLGGAHGRGGAADQARCDGRARQDDRGGRPHHRRRVLRRRGPRRGLDPGHALPARRPQSRTRRSRASTRSRRRTARRLGGSATRSS